MISSLPRIMHRDSTILEKPENAEKLPMGPTISRPGPTLPMQVTTAVKVVPKEKLSTDTRRMAARVMNI